jgi:hypothetical protein
MTNEEMLLKTLHHLSKRSGFSIVEVDYMWAALMKDGMAEKK